MLKLLLTLLSSVLLALYTGETLHLEAVAGPPQSSVLLALYTGETLHVEAVASPPVLCVVSPVYRRNITC